MMVFSKTEKFMAAVFSGAAVLMFLLWQSGSVSLDLNGLFNGILETIIGGFIIMSLTIWVYRYKYHRGK